MVRGFNVNQNQVNGSGDSLSDTPAAASSRGCPPRHRRHKGLLDARDTGFFTVEMPEFWDRPELSGMLRDVRQKPDKMRAIESGWRRLPCCGDPRRRRSGGKDVIGVQKNAMETIY